MKKLRFLIIILLSLTTILTSCTIVPHKFSWTINDVYKDIAYVNGNTIRTRLEHGIHSWNINGIHAQMTYIYFEDDSSLPKYCWLFFKLSEYLASKVMLAVLATVMLSNSSLPQTYTVLAPFCQVSLCFEYNL